MESIQIVETKTSYTEGFNAVVAVVARERRYISFVDGPPLDQSRSFIESILAGGGVQMLATTSQNQVVGWCDIIRDSRPGFGHVGKLGMGLLPGYRGQGIGRRLAEATTRAARAMGLRKIELEVYGSNQRAITFYHCLGFRFEGVKRQGRCLENTYEDVFLMAHFLDNQ